MTWRLSGNLVVISADVRSHYGRTTIGTIGDAAHRAEKSDHNPDSRNIVCAIDVMYPVGAKASAVVKACIGRSDLAYVIHNRTIWSASYGWKARRYTGDNPHTDHVHISSDHTSTADRTRTHLKWATTPATKPPVSSVPAFPGIMRTGSKGNGVKALQARLNAREYTPKLKVDGVYGSGTKANVIAFQRFAHVTQDGVVGSVTWGKLFTLKVT